MINVEIINFLRKYIIVTVISILIIKYLLQISIEIFTKYKVKLLNTAWILVGIL